MRKLSFLIVAFVLLACAKDPVPPGPGPGPSPGPIVPPGPTSFTVTGKKIVVEGKMKPGSKVPLASAESAVKTAVRMLESK